MENIPTPICKKCNRRTRNYMNVGTMTHAKPVENSITVCAFCATICKFDKDKNQVPLTHDEMETLAKADPVEFAILLMFKNYIENMLHANQQ